ncbi:MAG: FxsA family protein [Rhodospirillaceae bacterium]|jgi:UPF0716 protein FxsA|nr:FxsA family protein [Rhodospirillaceae bacterium]MBT5373058.1 FxsA family protein [Rhodospirillaceae bacterium]MBT5659158.1 FxsA family protein [Rhodospirillaceae bacterium]MBT5752616.1 FxsA family protein [Rhodospirillaceae bacterium]
MAPFILLIILAVPAIEIYLFIEIGGEIGFWPTLGLIILSASIGLTLLRHQGFATLNRLNESLENKVFPGVELFETLCLLCAGLLLLIPGFLTDTIGLLLFLPPLRMVLRRFLGHRLAASGAVHGQGADPFGPDPAKDGHSRGTRGPIIEGEYQNLDEKQEEQEIHAILNDPDNDQNERP